MKIEIFEKFKKEAVNLGILFVLFILIFKIIFFKESFFVVFRTVLSIFWIFVLPGYIIMNYWDEKLGFIERLVIGMALSAAVIGILSYYLGLIGLNIKYHAAILPLVLILIGLFINYRKIK